MLRRIYSIVMQTSIGDRAGTMDVHIRNEKITGYMRVLKRSEPFEGSIDENGNCQIQGTLVTLMSSIPYTASGQMTPDFLKLMLKGDRISFPVIGKLLSGEKAAVCHGEVLKEGSRYFDE